MEPPNRLLPRTKLDYWLNNLLEYAKHGHVRPGRGYKMKRGPQGTVLDIQPGVGGSTPAAGMFGCLFVADLGNFIQVTPFLGTSVPGGRKIGNSYFIYAAKPVRNRLNPFPAETALLWPPYKVDEVVIITSPDAISGALGAHNQPDVFDPFGQKITYWEISPSRSWAVERDVCVGAGVFQKMLVVGSNNYNPPFVDS